MRNAMILVVTACLLLPACKPEQRGPTPEEIAQQKVKQAFEAGTGEAGGPTTVIAVTQAGTNFDPAVRVEQIPAGAYYCDMGTVHYARLEEGDGRCPRCGMKLTKR
jgi:hypothetical protein